ncbi:MAG: hypothetical protein Q4P24_08275 [Rhodobacterales bacterium]|nr:hypothetical protein [Rhodobacterales bacterium]
MPTVNPAPKKTKTTKAETSAVQKMKPDTERKEKSKPQPTPRYIIKDFASI